MRLCVSSTPECSGLNPCIECFDIIRTRVLPKAMAATGGPYTDPEWGPPLIHNFVPAWREIILQIGPQLQPTLNAPPAPPPQVDKKPSDKDLASAADQVEEASEEIAAKEAPDPTTEDPEQDGYPIPPERMAEYMRQIRSPKTEAETPVSPTPPAALTKQTPSPEAGSAPAEGSSSSNP